MPSLTFLYKKYLNNREAAGGIMKSRQTVNTLFSSNRGEQSISFAKTPEIEAH